jgi:hypothetical protein
MKWGVGLLAVAGAVLALLAAFTESAGFTPDASCVADVRAIAAAQRLGANELGDPVGLQDLSEATGLSGGLGCAVFQAKGSIGTGSIGVAVERRDSRCFVSFWRTHPPDQASCRALENEARLRLTDLRE